MLERMVGLDDIDARVAKYSLRNVEVIANGEVVVNLLTQDAHESCGGHQHAHVWDHTAMIAQRKHEVVRLDAVNEAVAFIIYTNPNFIGYLDLVRDNYEYIFQKSSTDTVIPQFPSQAQVFQRTEHIGMGGVECKMVSTCLSYVRELAYLESPI